MPNTADIKPAPRHMAPAPFPAEPERPALDPLRVALVLLQSAVTAVVLEVLTLWGGPASSPLVPGDWVKRRILLFFVLVLLVRGVLHVCRTGERVRNMFRAMAEADPQVKAAAAAHTIVVIVVAVASWMGTSFATDALWGAHDFRYNAFVCAILVCVATLVAFRKQIADEPARGFLVISLALGVMMCSVLPTVSNVSWDGQNHFDRAQALSYIYAAQYTGADAMMSRDQGFDYLVDEETFDWQGLPEATFRQVAAQRHDAALQELEDTEGVIRLVGPVRLVGGSLRKVNVVGSIPNALGLWLGRLLHLPCVPRYFLGRMANVVFYCVVMFFAIRRLKTGKLALATLGLIPVNIFLAANYAYDPWCLSLIAYSFARYAGWLQGDDELTKLDVLGILVPFILGSLVKAVYFPLALAFLVAPGKRSEDEPELAFFRGATLVSMLLLASTFLLPFVFKSSGNTDARGGSTVSSSGQLKYVLGDPVNYFLVFSRFMASYFNPITYGAGLPLVLAYIVWPAEMPLLALSYLFVLFPLVLALVDRDERDDPGATHPARIMALIAFYITFGLVATSMYISFTPVGLDTINGVQLRYSLPLLLPLGIICLNFPARQLRLRLSQGAAPLAIYGAELALWVVTMVSLVFVQF